MLPNDSKKVKYSKIQWKKDWKFDWLESQAFTDKKQPSVSAKISITTRNAPKNEPEKLFSLTSQGFRNKEFMWRKFSLWGSARTVHVQIYDCADNRLRVDRTCWQTCELNVGPIPLQAQRFFMRTTHSQSHKHSGIHIHTAKHTIPNR